LTVLTLAGSLLLHVVERREDFGRAVAPGRATIRDGRGEDPFGTPLAERGPSSPAKVRLNTSSREDLLVCPGIGSATADLILRARAAGPFRDWADLAERVPGMGETRIGRLRQAGVSIGP